MSGGDILILSPVAAGLSLVCLLCLTIPAMSSEVCMIPFGNDYLVFYIKCPEYCCKYRNGTQYCCGDCALSVNADSCAPEMIWRYVLYVGLSIAGSIVLCYFIVFIIKNYKEQMKRTCCKHLTSRVQDPSNPETSASTRTDSRGRSHRPSVDDSADAAGVDRDSELCDRRYIGGFSSQPPPPAYSNASFTVAVEGAEGRPPPQQPQRRAETPPPVYSIGTEAAADFPAPAVAPNPEEPPPAYAESASSQQEQL